MGLIEDGILRLHASLSRWELLHGLYERFEKSLETAFGW